MAKGLEQHQNRQRALSSFGKDLTRRARSRCELCEAQGVPLGSFELPPIPAQPDFARCLFLCEVCSRELGGAPIPNPARWRCLNNTAWSDVPAVQAAAVLLLRRLDTDHPWAGELLESLYVSEEVRELLGEAEPAGEEA